MEDQQGERLSLMDEMTSLPLSAADILRMEAMLDRDPLVAEPLAALIARYWHPASGTDRVVGS